MRGAMQIEVGLDGTSTLSPAQATTTFCADSDCFTSLVRMRADANRTIVLAMTNRGFAPFFHNLRCTMERVDVAKHAIVIGTDEAACEAAASASIPCVVGKALLLGQHHTALSSSAEKHGTVEYAKLMHVKARPALAVLKLGYNLLFTDTDMVWLRNPLHELRVAYGAQLEHGALDVLIQSDHDESNEIPSCSQHEECARSAWCERRACEAEVCGGFYYLRASAPAIAMLEALFERMAWQRQNVDPRIGEQPALNYVLRRSSPPARYLVLPRELYPNGNAYFARRIWPRSSRALPIIIHNNWLAGAEAKRQRFIDHGLWFVKETKERSLDHAGHTSRHREAPACIAAALPAPNRGRMK